MLQALLMVNENLDILLQTAYFIMRDLRVSACETNQINFAEITDTTDNRRVRE